MRTQTARLRGSALLFQGPPEPWKFSGPEDALSPPALGWGNRLEKCRPRTFGCARMYFSPPHYIGCLFNQGRGGNRNLFCCSGVLCTLIVFHSLTIHCTLIHAVCARNKQKRGIKKPMQMKMDGGKETWTVSHVGFLHVCVYAHSRHPAI